MSADGGGPAGVVSGTGSDSTTLARGVGVLIPGRLAGRAAGYGVQLLLARLLGPAGYGQFAIGWKILLIGGLFAALGLDNGVVRYGATYLGTDNDALRTLVRRALGLSLLCGAVFGVALLAASPWLADSVYDSPDLQPILTVFAVGLILVPALRVGAAATRVWQNMRFSVLAEDIMQPVSQLLLVVVFYWLGLRVTGAAIAAVLSFALATALVVRFLNRLSPGLLTRPAVKIAPMSGIVAFSLPTSLAGTLAIAAMWIDLLLVGYFRSPAETGVYMAASQIAFLFTVVLTSFNAVFAPMISDLYHRDERRQLNELFRTSTRWGLLLGLPLFIVITVDPAGLLALFMGSDYTDGAIPMLILTIGQMANLCTGAVGFLLIMSGRQNWWLMVTAGALVLNVALNLLLIPRFGLEGAAAATSVSLAVLFAVGLVVVRSSIGLWPYDRSYLRLIVAALLAAAATRIPTWTGLGLSAPRTLLELVIATAVFWSAAGFGNRQTSIVGLVDALRGKQKPSS